MHQGCVSFALGGHGVGAKYTYKEWYLDTRWRHQFIELEWFGKSFAMILKNCHYQLRAEKLYLEVLFLHTPPYVAISSRIAELISNELPILEEVAHVVRSDE